MRSSAPIGKVVYDRAEELARMACEESGMGVYADKVAKCHGKSKCIWNSLKGKKSVGIIGEDKEIGIIRVAKAKGVVGSVTPVTNPVVTPMCNAMFALKGQNAIIVAPHPRTQNVNKYVVDLFRAELAKLGAPVDLIQTVEKSSIDATNALMQSVDVVVATGRRGHGQVGIFERQAGSGRRTRQRAGHCGSRRGVGRSHSEDHQRQNLRQRHHLLG